jgi:CRP-like cAMP-binding protein
MSNDTPRANQLLARFPNQVYRALLPALESVELPLGRLSTGRYPKDYVYFPVTGIVSLVILTKDGGGAECAIVGRDGMVGTRSLVEGANGDALEAQVQTAGEAYRLDASVLRQHAKDDAAVQNLMTRYLHAIMVQMSQTAICNRYHSIDQRLCRWLLQCIDLISGPRLFMTNQGMADMMGVRRERVTEVLIELEADRLIKRARGSVEVIDPAQVRTRACECYDAITTRTAKLLPPLK